LNLSQRYALASFFVLVVGASIIGLWLENKIQDGVVSNTAAATALYMDSFIAPLVQELATKDRLSLKNQKALDALLRNTAIGTRVVSMKIWKEGGLVAFSNRKTLIGKKFPPTENLKTAWKGVVAAEFNSLTDEEDRLERADNEPLLEMYSPIRNLETDRVICVAEFYQAAGELHQELFQAKLIGWIVVASVTMAMYLTLFGIVSGGSKTITTQAKSLERRVHELSSLGRRLEQASQRSVDISERVLRRIGSDLHDGPAQHLSIALLRMDALGVTVANDACYRQEDHDNFMRIKGALGDALKETRNISAGLALPELEGLSVKQVLIKAAEAHMRRTGMNVDMNIGQLPHYVKQSIKICLYRVVQETLNNSFQHAGTKNASLRAKVDNRSLVVTSFDNGPGFVPSQIATSSDGLGLSGLRERIESLGGHFKLDSAPGKGTTITVMFGLTS